MLNKIQLKNWFAIKPIPFFIIIVMSIIFWQFDTPDGLTAPAYHTAIIFIATIAAIITNVMPTGSLAIISLACYATLKAGGEEESATAIKNAMTDFNNGLIWLIVIAFMIALAFTKTGLGRRIALILLSKFGHSTLRIAYCLGIADFLIAPATPSNTARSAIISPIANSLAKTVNEQDRKLGQFLISSSSAMNDSSAIGFQTGFAGNLALVGIASSVVGIKLSFTDWAMYLLVPALFLLVLLPFVLYKFINPKTQDTSEAPKFAKKELSNMGKVTLNEFKLIITFLTLIFLWVGGVALNIDATTAAFIGLSMLLISGVLSWDDIKGEKGAWDTLIWFSVLMGMAGNLKKLGFTDWVGNMISDLLTHYLSHSSSLIFLLAMMTFYLFTAYFFASATAKVVALAPVILGALVTLNVDPMLSVLAIAGITNIGCNLATYSHARNPLLMGYGYHTDKEWMKIGLVISIVGAISFLLIGLLWWEILGIV